MDEVDIENADDLNELEARLYAQIHHEPSGNSPIASETYQEPLISRQVTSSSVINNKVIDKTRIGRYWNDKGGATYIPSKLVSKPSDKKESEISQILPIKSGELNENQVETVDKSFQPQEKNLSNLRVNPLASGNGPKSKGSSSQRVPSNVGKNKNDPKENKGPFDRQLQKLAKAKKYDGKKQKAKTAKAKIKTKSSVELIDLLSSNESEVDDVVEIPIPSPQILTIESTSEEEEEPPNNDNFVKPGNVAIKENSSRCTSPCSVMSDDFIGQSDRSRLLADTRPDDEDLIRLQEDVDSLIETPEKSASDSFVAPLRVPAKASVQSPDYRVTESNFRALDVYESESDIPESIYSKGTKTFKPSVVVNLDGECSSSDDVEEINVTQKTKRLRKRRASSTNKDSETIIESTDSEPENGEENVLNKSRDGVVITSVSYIARGEAIKDYVTKQLANQALVNSSDNEFITTLNTLAQGNTTTPEQAPNDGDSEEENFEITARSIAESVLRRESRNLEQPEEVVDHNEDANDAIPSHSLIELSEAFKQIDEMDNDTSVNVNDSNDSEQSVELVAPLPIKKASDETMRNKYATKMQANNSDPVYNVVFCEGATLFGGIGWNEEMRRFYNDSWKGEHFSVKSILSKMKTTKSLWKIYTDDRFPKYRKHSNQKCMNCCEFGHIRAKCPKPRKPAICYMCGERGHYEPRCPNTVCLRCGNKTRMFTKSCNSCNYQNRLICPICKVRGHNVNLCPDKWRRYHSTTKSNQLPNNKVEYKERKVCCICGYRGHLSEHCKYGLRFSEYPMCASEIRSHQKSYDDISIKTIRSGIGYNLMYKPQEDISFEFAENKTRRHYYGRFLIAVGMDYLLNRKRKNDVPAKEEPANKQIKLNTTLKEYVVNPFAKAALDKPSAKPPAEPEKQEVVPTDAPTIENSSEPSSSKPNTKELYALPASTSKGVIVQTPRKDLDKVKSKEMSSPSPKTLTATKSKEMSSSSPKTLTATKEMGSPSFTSPAKILRSVRPQPQQDSLEAVDSDSNYSFSEHFDTCKKIENTTETRQMDPLPDFIPIMDDDEDEDEDENEHNTGISKRFISVDTDEEENTESLPDIPCEAKIYLTNFHSNFLLSPGGNKFLIEKSNAFNIKARLEWTSVGHILVINGLRLQQDLFHSELLHKFRDLSEQMNRKQLEKSQKIPRKTESLIRFLRENLNQLQTNLGNVNDLIKRLTYLEKQQQHTKTGWKSAEKNRRLLNMILIGQAGLRNGSVHLDNLLSNLRRLIEDYKEETVTNEIRDEIESHWKLIFSSYRHEKYPEMIEAYNHMQLKNRFQSLRIDPKLLGKNVLEVSLSKKQKEKMDVSVEDSAAEKTITTPQLVPNPLSVKNQSKQPKTPLSEKKRSKIVPYNSPLKAQSSPNNPKQQQPLGKIPTNLPSQTMSAPNTPKQQQSVTKTPSSGNPEWETKCANLLTEIDSKDILKKGGSILDSKSSSIFWSREASKYIDKCMEVGKSNNSLIERLTRVQKKAVKGLLSYNDYQAIIKIHNAIKGKK